jgi:hypothetical protein
MMEEDDAAVQPDSAHSLHWVSLSHGFDGFVEETAAMSLSAAELIQLQQAVACNSFGWHVALLSPEPSLLQSPGDRNGWLLDQEREQRVVLKLALDGQKWLAPRPRERKSLTIFSEVKRVVL